MTTEPSFDPSAPLAGAGDPWESAPTPSWRAAPPYHMTDMIAAEPAVAKRTVERLAGTGPAADLAAAIRAALTAGEPVIVTGCGTSEHGAMAAVEILREAAVAAGLEGARITQRAGVRAGARAAATRTRDRHLARRSEPRDERRTGSGPDGRRADRRHHGQRWLTGRGAGGDRRRDRRARSRLVPHDRLSQPGRGRGGGRRPPVGPYRSTLPRVADLVADGTRDTAGAERIAARFADAAHLLVVASGADRPAGRELVLKVEEAAWLPSAYRDLETFLHGHLPATGEGTDLVLILTDRDRRAERLARARQALAAAKVIGLRAAAIVASGVDAELDPVLTPAGRLVITESPDLPAPVAALLGSATPLQLMTERLARARGTNPDLIRREDPVYLAAADAAEAPTRRPERATVGDGPRPRPPHGPRAARRAHRPSGRSCRGPTAAGPGA